MNRFGSIIIAVLFLFNLSCISQINYYVAPDGDDSGDGTAGQPFLTLQRARDAVREARKGNPGQQVVVTVKGGLYSFEEPVLFTSEDSGTEEAPLIYRAAEGEVPVFSGSRILENWKPLRDAGKLELLDPEVRTKIWVTDLNAEGISDFGDPIQIGKRPELYCNGQLQTLARWPDQGFTRAGLVRGETALPPTYISKQGTREGVFEYVDNRIDRWAKEHDPRLGGYWYWDWSMAYQTVGRMDTLSKTIFIEKPYHNYGYRDSLRYFGLNLFCEMDQPGEWYLDRRDGLLYWYPRAGIDISEADVTFSLFNAPFMVEMNDCSYMVLSGLAFEEGRGSSILISGGQDCLIADCRIQRFGEDGIHVQGGTGHGISGCFMQDFGCGGIKMHGGDRKNLIPANHFVENTVVEHFSRFMRTYEPAVYLSGCGSRLSNNRFGYSSSSAMRLEGNDFLVEYNQISHVVNESDDQGGVDMWYNPSYRGIVIRYNYWSDITGGTRHGAAGVRLDDMISEVRVYGNIFERVGSHHFGGVQIHGGKDNVIDNNLFYNCFAAVSFTPWGQERWLEQLDSPVIQEKIYEEVDIRSALYQEKYPGLKRIREDADKNIVKNNLIVDCKNRFLRDNGKSFFENNTSLKAGGKAVGAFCDPSLLEDYGLEPIPFQEIGPKNNKWLNQ